MSEKGIVINMNSDFEPNKYILIKHPLPDGMFKMKKILDDKNLIPRNSKYMVRQHLDVNDDTGVINWPNCTKDTCLIIPYSNELVKEIKADSKIKYYASIVAKTPLFQEEEE